MHRKDDLPALFTPGGAGVKRAESAICGLLRGEATYR